MARSQFTFTFHAAQPGAAVTFSAAVYSSPVDAQADGPTLALDAQRTVAVWTEGTELSATWVDGASASITLEASVSRPVVSTDLGKPGEAPASAASGPSVGRLKLADDSTFYGLPFGYAEASAGWLTFPAESSDGGYLHRDTVYYTLPVVFRDAIHVNSLSLIVNSAPPTDDDVRVAIVAADADWRPSGAPVFQTTITVPSSAVQFDRCEASTDFVLPAGRYMMALEEAFNGIVDDLSISLLAQASSFEGSTICSGTGPGILVCCTTAAHTYGPFTDPLPHPAAVVAAYAATLHAGENSPRFPVMFEWDPA